MHDYEENRYKQRIRITPEDLEWLKRNKGSGKSAAGFLEEIIKKYKHGKNKNN